MKWELGWMFSFQLLCLFFAPIRPPVIANANAVYSLGGKEMKNLYRTKEGGTKIVGVTWGSFTN